MDVHRQQKDCISFLGGHENQPEQVQRVIILIVPRT
jgi:hypothetical protein